MFRNQVQEIAVKAAALKIIIVGAGKVGSTLAEQLSKEGNDITIIDSNRNKVQDLTNRLDIMGIVGNGASFSKLDDAGIQEADLFIAVTRSDELNLLCCTIAKRSSDVASIARVRSPEYSAEIAFLRERLGLAMVINPDLELAREASRILYLPSALEVNSFARGQAELIKLRIPEGSALDGQSLADFGKNHLGNVVLGAVERHGDVMIPRGDTIMSAGDTLTFVASPRGARSFMKSVGVENKPIRNCMIVGGGRAAYYLASQLLNMGIEVKIIEKDLDRCNELTELLPEAVIIHGDGTDEDLLLEEQLRGTEAFVPLTGMDEENIMLTLHARKETRAKVVTKINRTTFDAVVEDLDLGSVLSPRYLTSDAIIAYVRAKRASGTSNIETLYHLFDNRVEALEFRVDDDKRITNIPLRDLQLQHNTLVCFINHKGHLIFPSGDDMIHAGDTVMIITTNVGYTEICDILA